MHWPTHKESPHPLGWRTRFDSQKTCPQKRACNWRCRTEADSLKYFLLPSSILLLLEALHAGLEHTHKHGQRPWGFFRNWGVPPSLTSLLWTHLRFLTWKRRSASWAGRCCSHCPFSAAWWWPGWLCCDWSLSQGSPGPGYRQSQQTGASWPPAAVKEEWKSLNRCKRLSWKNPEKLTPSNRNRWYIDCTQGISQTNS